MLISLISLYLFACLCQSPQETQVAFFTSHPTLFCISPPQSAITSQLPKPFHWVIWNSGLIVSKIPKILTAPLLFLSSPWSNWNLTFPWENCFSRGQILKYQHLYHSPPNSNKNDRLTEMVTKRNTRSQIVSWARKNIVDQTILYQYFLIFIAV